MFSMLNHTPQTHSLEILEKMVPVLVDVDMKDIMDKFKVNKTSYCGGHC